MIDNINKRLSTLVDIPAGPRRATAITESEMADKVSRILVGDIMVLFFTETEDRDNEDSLQGPPSAVNFTWYGQVLEKHEDRLVVFYLPDCPETQGPTKPGAMRFPPPKQKGLHVAFLDIWIHRDTKATQVDEPSLSSLSDAEQATLPPVVGKKRERAGVRASSP